MILFNRKKNKMKNLVYEYLNLVPDPLEALLSELTGQNLNGEEEDTPDVVDKKEADKFKVYIY
jgi:hypothetical protein